MADGWEVELAWLSPRVLPCVVGCCAEKRRVWLRREKPSREKPAATIPVPPTDWGS